MSRAFPVWLLASALCAFVGCGGGDATDSGAVAENSGAAAPTDGGGATAMPSGGGGMGSAGGQGMMGAGGAAEMNPEMMNGSGGDAGADPASAMNMEMNMEEYGAGAEAGAGPDGYDPAAMEAAYATSGGGAPGAGPLGSSSEEMGADYAAAQAGGANAPGSTLGGNYGEGANLGGAYPGGADSAGPDGAEAYAGGEYPGGPGSGRGAVEEKVPEGFDGKAQLAFRRGKEKDAMQFLYAHALTTDAGAESLLPTIRWVNALRQPKLAVRWGAGFVVTAPRNFNGDPKPVGTEQKLPTREGKRREGGNEGYVGGGGGEEYGAGGGGGGQNDSLLKKGAGELGEKLAAAYTERVMSGDFGEVLKTAMDTSSKGNRGNQGGDGAGGYGAGGYGAEGGPGYGAEGNPGGRGGPGGGGGAAADAATKVTQIMPGLSMLGIGTQKELIDRAREEDIDVVVIMEVKLRVNPEGLVTNDTTLALVDAKTQKQLDKTGTFNNIAIQKARAEGKEDNVDRELENFFEAIDANFKMTDLPAGLNAEVAGKRIAALAAEQHDNPLPVLAEARMYHVKGLLEESALFSAYEQLIGVDFGRMLSTGTEEDKKRALSRWLPES